MIVSGLITDWGVAKTPLAYTRTQREIWYALSRHFVPMSSPGDMAFLQWSSVSRMLVLPRSDRFLGMLTSLSSKWATIQAN